jgi:hypothetical protein
MALATGVRLFRRALLAVIFRPPGVRSQLLISSDHFFIFLSIMTTFAPELSEFCGQN